MELCKGTALQAAEKLASEVGDGFSHRNKANEINGALAPEGKVPPSERTYLKHAPGFLVSEKGCNSHEPFMMMQLHSISCILLCQDWDKLHLIFGGLCLTPRTMPASGLAAVSALQVISLGKDEVRPIHVIVNPFNQRLAFIRQWKAAHNQILPKAAAKENFD
jgi:hypothetical protein